ncbi:MAG: SPOR domain-containing protein [Candidatus Omnitrophica bacterium]|nr:SPOR domain-containing protein [Candidatus Omnitrophota bacterium]MBU1128758.1 SPOR domain-containing protein [Candidatus Omnitrophota bacterium]MBU1783983.1 SPOR domain-containing protein [Candidatus Omnitrophota bacterium]MBU1851249.1 SPOR domain-containing protein [Candidatus Omnitrophota bacterium]
MTDDQFQDDFFNHASSGCGKRLGFKAGYPVVRFMPHVRIPVEYVVVFGIAMLVLLVVAYAAGVESGKRSVPEQRPADIVVIETMPELTKDAGSTDISGSGGETPDEEGEEKAESDVTTDTLETKETRKPWELSVLGEKAVAKPDEAAYTIQLAAFTEKENVEKETAKLKEAGNDAAYVKVGKWYQSYVKGYKTIGEARGAKEKFIEEYQDCYIRKQ